MTLLDCLDQSIEEAISEDLITNDNIMRDRGAFGTTTVLDSDGSDDLSTIPGVLVFGDKEIEK